MVCFLFGLVFFIINYEFSLIIFAIYNLEVCQGRKDWTILAVGGVHTKSHTSSSGLGM